MFIAKRTLQANASQGLVPVEIRIENPEEEGEKYFVCRYEIGWPEGVHYGYMAGVDSCQALHLCQQKIGADLYLSAWHQSGRLIWPDQGREQGGGYGFPVPKNMRGDLVGYDKTFEG